VVIGVKTTATGMAEPDPATVVVVAVAGVPAITDPDPAAETPVTLLELSTPTVIEPEPAAATGTPSTVTWASPLAEIPT
jgi:hypothetical protein